MSKNQYPGKITQHSLFWVGIVVLYYIDYEPITVYRTEGVNSFFLQEKAWKTALWNTLSCLIVAYFNLLIVLYLEKRGYINAIWLGVKFKILYFILVVLVLACANSYLTYLFCYHFKDKSLVLAEIYLIQYNATAVKNEMWYRNFPETVFIMIGLITIYRAQTLEKYNLELEREKDNLEIQINLLKKRMEPHFLIGVLNGIFLEVNKKLPKAGEQIDMLSSQLRYILKGCDQIEVLLSEEVSFVRDYIKLKRLEQGNKNVMIEDKMILSDFSSERKIMPLMLVEFVENAFKYSFGSKGGRHIQIHLFADEDNNICVYLANRRPNVKFRRKNNTIISHGEGVKNLKKRLQLTYPNAHELTIFEDEPTKYEILLKIKN